MSLSSYRIPFLIPYFVEMQRKSFLNFLDTGLIYELSRKNPMYDSLKEFQIIFYPEYYQLSTPEYTPQTAILKFKTYSSKLYIPLQLTNFKSKQLKLHWIILGNLPLMTKRGSFIVNGSPRIVVNQIVRSPGVYYKQTIDLEKRKTYYGDLISQRGAWLRIEIDKKKRVWIQMKKTRKIPALIFFHAVGISDLKLKEFTKYWDFLKTSQMLTQDIETEDYFHPKSIQDSLLWIYKFVYPDKKRRGEVTLKKAKKFLFRKFFSHRSYDLGYSGRDQLNKKFNSNIDTNICVLTPQDLLFALDYLLKFEQGVGLADDIDHLKNRRVRTSGELIQNQLGTGLIRLQKLIRDKTRDSESSILNICNTKPLDGALREFFGSSPLSQFMDQVNPLAELTHKRRISSLGPGGVSRETAGIEVRGIHPSHYGRICPIETPEGRNAGLVNSITTLAQVDEQGLIKTPFYYVYQGQVQKYQPAALFSAAQEQHIVIAPSDLKTNYFNFLPYCSIPVRASGDFKKLRRNHVQYMSVSPIQMISIATSLIPFLEHDDANRALMGSNMQRQAVPVILPERPTIGTGLEARIVSDAGHGLQTKISGIVSYTSNKNILVTNFGTRPSGTKTQNAFKYKFFWANKIIKKSRLNSESEKHCQHVLACRNRRSGLLRQKAIIYGILEYSCEAGIQVPEKIKFLNRKKSQALCDKLQSISNDKDICRLNTQDNRFGTWSLFEVGPTNFRDNSSIKYLDDSHLGVSIEDRNSISTLYFEKLKPEVRSEIQPRTEYQVDSLSYKQSLQSTGDAKILPQNGYVQSTCKYFVQSDSPDTKYQNSKKPRTKYPVTTPRKSFERQFLSLCDLINHNKKIVIVFKKSNLDKWVGFTKSWSIKNQKPKSFSHSRYQSNPETFFLDSPLSGESNEISPSKQCQVSWSKRDQLQATDYLLGNQLGTSEKHFKSSPSREATSYGVHWLKKFPYSILDYKSIWTSTFRNALIVSRGTAKDQMQITPVVISSIPFCNQKIDSSKKISLGLSLHTTDSLYKQTVKYKKTLKYLRNFIKKFRNECVQVSFLQIFIEKKNLKHIFLFSSRKWQNFNSKKFAKLRFFKKTKSSNFYKIRCYKVSKQYEKPTILRNSLISDSTGCKPVCFPGKPTITSKLSSRTVVTKSQSRLPWSKVSNFQAVGFPQNAENLQPGTKYMIGSQTHTLNNDSIKSILSKEKISSGKSVLNSLINFPRSVEHQLASYKVPNLRLKSQKKIFNTTTNHTVLPYQHSNQNTCMRQTSLVGEGEWVQKGDFLADGAASVGGELALGKSILVAYMPWEGYNFEDAILVSENLVYNDIYTSIHIEKYKIEISDTQYGLEQITPNVPHITIKQKSTLNVNGVIKLGSWVTQGDILVGKVTPILKQEMSGHEKLLADILGTRKNPPTVRDSSLRVPKHVSGRIVHIELLENENVSLDNLLQGPSRVHIYIAEKRKLQVGDKMSGRHGNKGIISNILPRQDMPYLSDGTPIDMVLNPLGVPSRMNVGQIFECLLGLAAKELNEHYRISCFDEMSGPEASRSFTYSKLFEARLKTQKHWLFNPNYPGKMQLFDGRSGECFHQKVTVGQPYMLKLVHLVDEKIHARATGPYSLVTQQPVRGRSKHGGQRLGEMEVWALQGFGAAYTLQELLTAKSDDIKGRHQVMQAILEQKSILLGTPESFKVLLSELQSLCLNIGVYSINNSGTRKKIDIMQLSEVTPLLFEREPEKPVLDRKPEKPVISREVEKPAS